MEKAFNIFLMVNQYITCPRVNANSLPGLSRTVNAKTPGAIGVYHEAEVGTNGPFLPKNEEIGQTFSLPP
ncbi:hypothetical protein AGMMS50267_13440 [Spirochaetia bacterium]|nr:hypothetical protein AGMMS50267_13440 [Spirochaetia bacterium]